MRGDVAEVWAAYQALQYGFVTRRLPYLPRDAKAAAEVCDAQAIGQAHHLLALSYHAAATILTKLGEPHLAWIAADRGLQAAQTSGDQLVIGSLLRAIAHALLSAGQHAAAVELTRDTAALLQPALKQASPGLLAVYGTLFLAGSMAAARQGDRATVREFLAEADASAGRIGRDSNYLWTAFGPTNVLIHRVAAAVEFDDMQVAVDLGPRVDTSALPIERRVRHTIEVARAFTAWNRPNEALAALLDAEQLAPEQVRNHRLSRQLVLTWMRRPGKASTTLSGLAYRVGVG